MFLVGRIRDGTLGRGWRCGQLSNHKSTSLDTGVGRLRWPVRNTSSRTPAVKARALARILPDAMDGFEPMPTAAWVHWTDAGTYALSGGTWAGRACRWSHLGASLPSGARTGGPPLASDREGTRLLACPLL
jgi:hypothetical protein